MSPKSTKNPPIQKLVVDYGCDNALTLPGGPYYVDFNVRGRKAIKGKTVRCRRGPAAVTGDESRSSVTVPLRWNGKTRQVRRSGSRKTFLQGLVSLSPVVKGMTA